MNKIILKLSEMQSICDLNDICEGCEIEMICEKYCGRNTPDDVIDILQNIEQLENEKINE